MGGRRRLSKAQGIRKKRKSANKQTLARVAEYKEAQTLKLQRKIAAAEERVRVAQAAQLGITPRSEQTESDENETVLRLEHEDDNDPQSQIVARKLEAQQAAYQSLVRDLSRAREGRGGKREKKGVTDEPAVAKRPRAVMQSDGQVARDQKTDSYNVPPQGTAEIDQKHVEKQNYAAASREAAHFETSLKPEPPGGKLSTIGVFPGIGKVSAALPRKSREKFENTLASGLKGADISGIGMQPSVFAKWQAARRDLEKDDNSRSGDQLIEIHRVFVSVLREYQDIFLSRTVSDKEEDLMRWIYTAHCVSHVLRCRGRLLRNDAALKKHDEQPEDTKDQGFSRARVLLLLPFKNVAYDVVRAIKALAVGADDGEKDVSHVANSERFEKEFAPDPDESDLDETEATSAAEVNGADSVLRTGAQKPRDHQRLFRGNVDDDFKLGIAFTKKTMRLYTDFYESDIVVASPLGLRRTIAEKAAGQAPPAKQKKDSEETDTEWKTGIAADTEKPKFSEADDDFLSSIEICVVDSANVFSMQNWDTLLQTVGMMSKMPVSTRDTDFSRVRDWCLDGLMRRFRQTVMLSSYRKSEFASLFREFSNHAGKVCIAETRNDHGSMSDVVTSMRQTFFKVPDVSTPAEAPDKRLTFFFEHSFPRLRALVDSQCLLVVPNYFDYVHVRNKLVKISDDDSSFRFASMCEYSKGSDISRARSRLFDRSVSLVIMTERFHFYWRHWIRGANTIAWYGLPENSQYYPEILNMTAEAAEMGRPVQSIALYDMFDAFALERIVGQTRSKRMTAKNARSTFLFV